MRWPRRGILAAVLGAALVGRLAWAFASAPARGGVLWGDEATYDLLGWNLLTTGQLAISTGAPTALREPLYPLFVALVYALAGHRPAAVLFAQALLGTLACGLVYLVAARVCDRRSALWACAAAAAYPPLVYFTGTLLRETLVVFLLLASVWAAQRAAEEPRSAGRALLAGALLGLATLATSVLGLVAAAFAAAFAAGRGRRRAALLLVLGCAAVYWPWVARNQSVFGTLILGSTNGGKTFWDGTDRIPFEVRGLPREQEFIERDPDILQARALPDEVARDRFFYRRAVARLQEDPRRALRLTAEKFVKFWRPWPHAGRSYGIPRWLQVLLGAVFTLPALLLGAAGALLLPWRRTWPLLIPLLVIPPLYALYWSQARYRLPLEPLLLVLASGAAGRLREPGPSPG